jgi:hypothetical protein
MATMMRMVFTYWLMGHSTIQMGTILTKMVMMSLVGTMMINTSITSLGLVMKMNIMQSIRKCMEMKFMRRRKKSKLLSNIKLRMKTTTL